MSRLMTPGLAMFFNVMAIGCGDSQDSCTVLEVYLLGDPTLIAIRQQGEWVTMERGTPTVPYTSCVDNDYTVLSVCQTADRVSVTEAFGSVAERNTLALGFCNYSPPAVESVHVTGRMIQAGSVFVGGVSNSSLVGSWDFDVSVRAGRHSLVATDANLDGEATRVAVRRNLQIEGSTTLADVDLEAEGEVMVSFDLPLVLGDEAQTSSSTLVVDGVAQQISQGIGSRGRGLTGLPDGDYQILDTRAVATSSPDKSTARFVSYRFRDSFSPVEFLPRLDNDIVVSADRHSVDLSSNPIIEFGYVNFSSVGDNALFLTATAGWLVDHGPSLGPDTSAPGFQPEWLDQARSRETTEVVLESDTNVRASAVSESVSTAEARAAREHER